LAGLIRPSSGTVQVAGVPAHEIAVRNTGAVGLLTAEPGLYPLLTGWENLEFFGAVLGVSRADVRAKAGVWLEKLGLAGDMNRRTGTWSSGMRQKLSLVRARLMAPRLLLLDEPTANLDPVSAATLWALVRAEAQAGLCVVLVTHDLISAEHLCHRVVFLERTLRHVEEMPGPRAAPESGRLLSLYRQVVGER
jgi:ABC-2 type transport system ATP-binding protein